MRFDFFSNEFIKQIVWRILRFQWISERLSNYPWAIEFRCELFLVTSLIDLKLLEGFEVNSSLHNKESNTEMILFIRFCFLSQKKISTIYRIYRSIDDRFSLDKLPTQGDIFKAKSNDGINGNSFHRIVNNHKKSSWNIIL